jgi:N-methylhydantoinase A
MTAERDTRYRIGIDVGGTFTKAALLDDVTHAIVARASVHTTHDHPRGVAAGVVDVFRAVLDQSGIAPTSIVFLAHSTTQATNALLEGDVATVGVFGIAGVAAAKLAEPQVKVAPIDLGSGRCLSTVNRFCPTENLTAQSASDIIAALKSEGADVIVASAAFGVDDTGAEDLVRAAASAQGLATTCGHEITRLYGLAVRTRTAVVNASILPRMIATADMTEASVREAGISAPLMIMRSDGGVMDFSEMRRRPAMTMLSGPAASIAGALMHVRMSDGIYFEVGGTSTNLGVIQSGRPSIAYARIGGHETYLTSLDVRVIGIAGGSLVRAKEGAVIDVGPRSAHIAGLPYSAFAPADVFSQARLELFAVAGGDPDHVAVRGSDGVRYALTNTCAANVLGTARPGMHCYAGTAAARAAFAPFARFLGLDVDRAARAVLDCAAAKITPVIESIVQHYKLEADQQTIIGVGGGAGALIPIVAERMGLRYEIAPNAEIISSIGSALAMVREVIERIIPHMTPDDIQRVRQEAIDAVAALGANRDTIEVTIDVDRLTQRVRAIASGAAEMRARGIGGTLHETEARAIAARSLGIATSALALSAETSGFRVYQPRGATDGPVRCVDAEGVLRVQRGHAHVVATTAAVCLNAIRAAFDQATSAISLYVLVRHRLIDLTGLADRDPLVTLASAELLAEASDERVILVVVHRLA